MGLRTARTRSNDVRISSRKDGEVNDAAEPASRSWRQTVSVLAATVVFSTGCATTGSPQDPLEGFNRAMFSFNEGLDKVAIKPLAQGYDFVVPLPGKTMVSNFFGNLQDPWIAANNLLQGKPGQALTDAGRFLINSTVGILGAFDVASELGIEKHEEDFGQTVARWGVGAGAYLVLPFFGPRTFRDALTLIVDGYGDPVYYLVDDVPTRNILYGTRLVSNRASVLPADKTIDEAALDKYAYLRDAYLQRRRNLIFDGRPPRETDEDAATDPGGSLARELTAPDAVSPPVLVASDGAAVAPGTERQRLSEPGFNDSVPSRVTSPVDTADAAPVAAATGSGAE